MMLRYAVVNHGNVARHKGQKPIFALKPIVMGCQERKRMAQHFVETSYANFLKSITPASTFSISYNDEFSNRIIDLTVNENTLSACFNIVSLFRYIDIPDVSLSTKSQINWNI